MKNFSDNFPSLNFIYDYTEDIRRMVALINEVDDKISDEEIKLKNYKNNYQNLVKMKSRNFTHLMNLKLKIDKIFEKITTLTDFKICFFNKMEKYSECYLKEIDMSIEKINSIEENPKRKFNPDTNVSNQISNRNQNLLLESNCHNIKNSRNLNQTSDKVYIYFNFFLFI